MWLGCRSTLQWTKWLSNHVHRLKKQNKTKTLQSYAYLYSCCILLRFVEFQAQQREQTENLFTDFLSWTKEKKEERERELTIKIQREEASQFKIGKGVDSLTFDLVTSRDLSQVRMSPSLSVTCLSCPSLHSPCLSRPLACL